MKVVIQRVKSAKVVVDGNITGEISNGLLLLLGISSTDTEEQVRTAAGKICRMRIFEDAQGKMNLSVQDTGGKILAVSQFTLLADTRKGNRPSFVKAARPEIALPLYEKFCTFVKKEGISVEKGIFGAHMEVELVNDGPVTIIVEY